MNFLDLAKKRFSSRTFLDKPIEKEKLDYIFEAARIAPSAANKQAFYIFLLTKGVLRDKVNATYKGDWISQAPALLVICSNSNVSWKHSITKKDHADIDAAIAIDHMTLALLIPESDEDAQTRATTALERGLPVFVKADTEGNRTLIDQGALLLTDPGEVVEWVQQALVDAAIQETDVETTEADVAAAPLTTNRYLIHASSLESHPLPHFQPSGIPPYRHQTIQLHKGAVNSFQRVVSPVHHSGFHQFGYPVYVLVKRTEIILEPTLKAKQ